ncbi:hypothetical protein BSLG_010702 [Batrachochytrium salamandrivorans]|nr:hypothetical protein BSLG_010702 [Batrachochytrium salamandrivorans]
MFIQLLLRSSLDLIYCYRSTLRVDNSHKHAAASLNPASTSFPFHFLSLSMRNIPHSGVASSSFSKKDDVKTATDFISKSLSSARMISRSQHLAKRDITVSAPKATVDFAKASATASAPAGMSSSQDGKIVYAYKLQLRNNPVTKWVEVWCDATTGKESSRPLIWATSGKPPRQLGNGVFDTQFNSRRAPGTDNIAAAAVNLFP